MAIFLPQEILEQLSLIEHKADYSGSLPRIKSSTGKVYYVKIGETNEHEQFVGEAESLKFIERAAPGIAPHLFSSGVLQNNCPYLIAEYRDRSPLTSHAGAVLGEQLAIMHSYKSPRGFGFDVPTYCGVTRLKNGRFDTWEKCFSSMIEEILEQLRRRTYYEELYKKAEEVRESVIPKLLGPLKVDPVLLHGDLWCGNASVDEATGKPFIFDPSSYFGHNEADLSIARIFGGFPESFYRAYHAKIPETEPKNQYNIRLELYKLFHYLNHALIFGGTYKATAEGAVDKLLAWGQNHA